MGPYAYKDNQWVSYDDRKMLHKKSELVRTLNLGGGMVWALDLDDFNNRCGEGKHPLLTEIHNVLSAAPGSNELERKFNFFTFSSLSINFFFLKQLLLSQPDQLKHQNQSHQQNHRNRH